MKVFILIVLSVGCYGAKWDYINDFKDVFKEYSGAAQNAIISMENVIDSSKKQSTLFLDKIYDDPSLNKLTVLEQTTPLGDMKTTQDNECNKKYIKKDNLQSAFDMQIFQLAIPLQNRIIEIREKLNNINETIDIYQALADSKYLSCQVFNKSCFEETNTWLESMVHSLACTTYTNCQSHSIRKRSNTCSSNEFRCRSNDRCIPESYFCDGSCNCNYCSEDEPSGCVRYCHQFRCKETFRCISRSLKCDGNDDCGDGSDEENCPQVLTFSRSNCSIDTGEFFCNSEKCIGLEQVCDGYEDCDDGTDEGQLCADKVCSPDCSKMGGVCLSGPKGPECLYECPPGTFETSNGCSIKPEAPLETLAQVIDDTPRLISRYATRLKYLKMKINMELSRSMQEVVRCKRNEFTLLSKVIRFNLKLSDYLKPSTQQVSTHSTVIPISITPLHKVEVTTPVTNSDYGWIMDLNHWNG